MPQIMTQRVPMETIYDQIDRVLEQLVQEAALIISDVGAAVEHEIDAGEDRRRNWRRHSGRARAGRIGAGRGRTRQQKVTTFFESQIKPFLLSRHSREASLGNPARRLRLSGN